MKPFSPADHVGPQPIIKEQVRKDIIPPAMVSSRLVLPLLVDPMKGILGNLQNSPQRFSNTGGKGSITQWVHAEYMEGSETIRPTFTQWVRGGYFSKVPTKVPTG